MRMMLATFALSAASALAQSGTFNGHGYEVVHDGGSDWYEAEAHAAARGGHLVTITSAEENDFVYSLITAASNPNGWYWIGLNDTAAEGTFVWVTGEPFGYSNFAGGQPDNGGGVEDCVHFWNQPLNSWNDWVCSNDPNGYIIEWEPSTVPTLGPGALAILAGLVALGGAIVVRRLRAA